MIKILGLDLSYSHYSRFSRRAKDLKIPMRKIIKKDMPIKKAGIFLYNPSEKNVVQEDLFSSTIQQKKKKKF